VQRSDPAVYALDEGAALQPLASHAIRESAYRLAAQQRWRYRVVRSGGQEQGRRDHAKCVTGLGAARFVAGAVGTERAGRARPRGVLCLLQVSCPTDRCVDTVPWGV
jgi:hypothetical protein